VRYRLVTRSDFDGLVCAVLLRQLDLIDDVLFVHPKDVQDGLVEVTGHDILTNLPYAPAAHLVFDHHHSESLRTGGTAANHVIITSAPSAARVVYDHYGGAEQFPRVSEALMAAVDQADSAQYELEDVLHPTGWTLLNFLMDSRTGLGRFRDFRISNYQLMMQLIDWCIAHQDVDEILALPDVAERAELFRAQETMFVEQLRRVTTVHGDVGVVDLRGEDVIHAGNRFMVYALFPRSGSRSTCCGARASRTRCSPSASRSSTAPPRSTSARWRSPTAAGATRPRAPARSRTRSPRPRWPTWSPPCAPSARASWSERSASRGPPSSRLSPWMPPRRPSCSATTRSTGRPCLVERVRTAAGSRVRKELRRADLADQAGAAHWASSTDPRHWNYWRREAEVYRDEQLRTSLVGTGLGLAGAEVVEHEDGASLWLEDVVGTAGPGFSVEDHVAAAVAIGRWQGQPATPRPWQSRRFLREYSTSRPWDLAVVDDDGAWAQPLIRDTWPGGLREGWTDLLRHRDQLLDVMEQLPRTLCHLDAWVSNAVRRPDGTVVMLDWAFAGDGAVGEDLGNWLPDAVFDLFWPAEQLGALEAACYPAYLRGLRDRGWQGSDSDARLGVVASCVKYAWLLPLLLTRAGDAEQKAYHRQADPRHLYRQRGLALDHLVGWTREALSALR
jgi:hypothetical protein